jgi:3-dehydroquinate dehydratase
LSRKKRKIIKKYVITFRRFLECSKWKNNKTRKIKKNNWKTNVREINVKSKELRTSKMNAILEKSIKWFVSIGYFVLVRRSDLNFL